MLFFFNDILHDRCLRDHGLDRRDVHEAVRIIGSVRSHRVGFELATDQLSRGTSWAAEAYLSCTCVPLW